MWWLKIPGEPTIIAVMQWICFFHNTYSFLGDYLWPKITLAKLTLFLRVRYAFYRLRLFLPSWSLIVWKLMTRFITSASFPIALNTRMSTILSCLLSQDNELQGDINNLSFLGVHIIVSLHCSCYLFLVQLIFLNNTHYSSPHKYKSPTFFYSRAHL